MQPYFFADFRPQFIAPAVVITFLIYFLIKYGVYYWRPAHRLQRELRDATAEVNRIRTSPIGDQRQGLTEVFKGPVLEHSWLEFNETLHDQYQLHEGENSLVRVRSTMPSTYFFTAQKIIDTPLRSEYFRHLPGILTGIGIIGTFAGLMLGLFHFDPSDPEKVQQSVSNLLNDVLYAFVGSMLSIAVAMVVTNSEKNNLRLCISALEKLTDAIDRIFDAGVGEEYLAELVRHTQESSTQTRMLKDSLVTDLREMLENLVDAQVKQNVNLATTLSTSYKESGRDIATQISESIEASFREPLNQLAKSVQNVTTDQSGKMQSLLQDVLVAFMQKLETTFGGQFNGMQEMLGQSINSMQSMQAAFGALVEDMRAAGESSGRAVQDQLARTLADMHGSQNLMQASMNEMVKSLQRAVENIGANGEQAGSRMSEQMQRIFAESEARQEAMTEQMQVFFERMKESVGRSQQETIDRIGTTVDQLGTQLGSMLSKFDDGRRTIDATSSAAYEEQQKQIGLTLASMHASQASVQSVMDDLMTSLRGTVASIGEQGHEAGTRIGKQLEKAQADSATHQQQMANTMEDFMAKVQSNITEGQADSIMAIAATVEQLDERLGAVITTFQRNRHDMDTAAHVNQEKLHTISKALIEGLSAQANQLLQAMQASHEATRQTIQLLGDQTARNLTGMQAGADKINHAAAQFTTAGNGIAQVATSTALLAGNLEEAAGELGDATDEMVRVLDTASTQRQALQQAIVVIESIARTAQAEGGMRGQVLTDMKAASEQIRVLNEEARAYLEQVNDVLGNSFDSFGQGVERTLIRTLASFDAELERAVKVLGGGVQDLSENLDTFSDMVEKSTRNHRAA